MSRYINFIGAVGMYVLTIATLEAAELQPSRMKAGTPKQGWSLAFDNDLLAGGARDKDFTYGLNFTQKGGSQNGVLNPARFRSGIDKVFKLHRPGAAKIQGNSLELGLYGFTPEDISRESVIEDDRPYASLVYAASTQTTLDVPSQEAVSSSFSLGVLGLDLVGSLQNNLHASVDGEEAMGWANQISAGGELTARYTLSKQRLLPPVLGLESKSTWQISLGYITEASYSLGFRQGLIDSHWWEFDPELTIYAENASNANSSVRERYVWGGVAVKARAYNSFLQGQARSSAHTYNSNDLRHFLLEAWAGYTHSFANHYRFSYVLRAHSSEIKAGNGDRSLVWGGVVFSKNLQ